MGFCHQGWDGLSPSGKIFPFALLIIFRCCFALSALKFKKDRDVGSFVLCLADSEGCFNRSFIPCSLVIVRECEVLI